MVNRKIIGASLWIVACIFVLFFTNWRVKNARQNLEEYWAAKDCPTSVNCREKVDAIILDSRSVDLKFNGGKARSLYETSYILQVSTEGFGTQKIKIIGNPATNGTPFDIPNVITLGPDTQIVLDNLFSGRTIYLEMWRNKITLMYLDALVKLPPPESLDSTEENQQAFISAVSREYDTAIATEEHPIILLSNAERDFYGITFIISWIVWFGVLGLFSGIRDIVKKKKSEKMELA